MARWASITDMICSLRRQRHKPRSKPPTHRRLAISHPRRFGWPMPAPPKNRNPPRPIRSAIRRGALRAKCRPRSPPSSNLPLKKFCPSGSKATFLRPASCPKYRSRPPRDIARVAIVTPSGPRLPKSPSRVRAGDEAAAEIPSRSAPPRTLEPADSREPLDRYGRPAGGKHAQAAEEPIEEAAPSEPQPITRRPRAALDAPAKSMAAEEEQPARPDGVGRPGDPRLSGSQAPTLTIEKTAPPEIQIGKPAKFSIKVRNTGTVTAQGVEIHDTIPQGTQLVDTVPPATRGPQGELVWDLGAMRPGDEQKAELELMPMAEGEIGSVATVHFRAEASVRTRGHQADVVDGSRRGRQSHEGAGGDVQDQGFQSRQRRRRGRGDHRKRAQGIVASGRPRAGIRRRHAQAGRKPRAAIGPDGRRSRPGHEHHLGQGRRQSASRGADRIGSGRAAARKSAWPGPSGAIWSATPRTISQYPIRARPRPRISSWWRCCPEELKFVRSQQRRQVRRGDPQRVLEPRRTAAPGNRHGHADHVAADRRRRQAVDQEHGQAEPGGPARRSGGHRGSGRHQLPAFRRQRSDRGQRARPPTRFASPIRARKRPTTCGWSACCPTR